MVSKRVKLSRPARLPDSPGVCIQPHECSGSTDSALPFVELAANLWLRARARYGGDVASPRAAPQCTTRGKPAVANVEQQGDAGCGQMDEVSGHAIRA